MSGHRATVGVVFLIVFIDLVGFGIVIPILPLYAERFGPSPVLFGLLMASFSAMQLVAAPILGRLSDRFGRRPVLLVSLAGSAVGYLMFGFAGSMAVLLASRIVDGISGGNISTAQAVIADITDPEHRARGMGMIGAAFGLGFICGPAIAALLLPVAPWLPGVAAAVMSVTAFVLVLVLLPETRPEGVAGASRVHPLTGRALGRAMSHPLVPACLVMIFLVIFAFSNFEVTFAQLATGRYRFADASVGWLFMYAGVLGALVQGGLVGRLARRFGEDRLLVCGAILAAVAGGALPHAATTAPLLGLLAVLALGHGLAQPSLASLTSQLVTADEVGGTMGVYQGMSSLARIFGPFWAEWSYGTLGDAWPYHTAAALYLVVCAVGLWLLRRRRRRASAPAG